MFSHPYRANDYKKAQFKKIKNLNGKAKYF